MLNLVEMLVGFSVLLEVRKTHTDELGIGRLPSGQNRDQRLDHGSGAKTKLGALKSKMWLAE